MRSRPGPRSFALSALRPLAGACVVLVLTAAAMPEARRHVHLVKSEPAGHDTLTTAPQAVTLWFSESIELKVTTIKLTAAGRAIPLGAPALRGTGKDAPVVATLAKTIPPGSYAVAWSTASRDGHPAKGRIDFVVLGPR